MRIAVIADTHNRVPSTLLDRILGADEIWHLGDVCDPSTLDDFHLLAAPLKLVRGNCDACFDWPLTLDLERGGCKVRLVHIPPNQAPIGVSIVLHGHTHVPRDETIRGVRYLNPGCVTRPNRGAPPSFAWLEFREGIELGWNVVRL